jgi:hypothetical protein
MIRGLARERLKREVLGRNRSGGKEQEFFRALPLFGSKISSSVLEGA